VGKTHLAVALAETAIQSRHAANFMTAHDLVTDLGRAYREGRPDRRLRIHQTPKILVIDEVGYLPLDGATAIRLNELRDGNSNGRPVEKRELCTPRSKDCYNQVLKFESV